MMQVFECQDNLRGIESPVRLAKVRVLNPILTFPRRKLLRQRANIT